MNENEKILCALGAAAVCYEHVNLFPSWAPAQQTLPAFGIGISRWLNPDQLVVIVVFHNPDPFSWCLAAPEICFLCCWLGSPPIVFPQNCRKTKQQQKKTTPCVSGLINYLLQQLGNIGTLLVAALLKPEANCIIWVHGFILWFICLITHRWDFFVYCSWWCFVPLEQKKKPKKQLNSFKEA